MVENQSIKAIAIGEMGMKLGCTTECMSLALYTYHRFFAECNATMTQYDVIAVGAVCCLLASKELDMALDIHDVVNVLVSTLHQLDDCSCIDPERHKQWCASLAKLEGFIARNIGYKLSYVVVDRQTPGFMFSSNLGPSSDVTMSSTNNNSNSTNPAAQSSATSITNNNNNRPGSHHSGHKLLVHFLKSLNEWLNNNDTGPNVRLNNVAWSYLSDFYRSSRVIHFRQDYLACAAIEMALKTLKISLPFHEKAAKPWYKVFCEDLTEAQLDRIVVTMIDEYIKYDQLIENELTSSVISCLRDEVL